MHCGFLLSNGYQSCSEVGLNSFPQNKLSFELHCLFWPWKNCRKNFKLLELVGFANAVTGTKHCGFLPSNGYQSCSEVVLNSFHQNKLSFELHCLFRLWKNCRKNFELLEIVGLADAVTGTMHCGFLLSNGYQSCFEVGLNSFPKNKLSFELHCLFWPWKNCRQNFKLLELVGFCKCCNRDKPLWVFA